MQNRSLNVLTVKKFEFPKSKMAEAVILKTVKSPYLSNRLTDFDEIWHADANWPPTGDRSLKFSTFQKKNKMAAVVIFKNHTNRDITTRDCTCLLSAHVCIMSLSLCLCVRIFAVIKTRCSNFPALLMMMPMARFTASQVGQEVIVFAVLRK